MESQAPLSPESGSPAPRVATALSVTSFCPLFSLPLCHLLYRMPLKLSLGLLLSLLFMGSPKTIGFAHLKAHDVIRCGSQGLAASTATAQSHQSSSLCLKEGMVTYTQDPGTVTYTQDPHSKEAEAEGSPRVQGHPMLLGEF